MTSIHLQLIRTSIALGVHFTAIIGMFPSCVHAVMHWLTSILALITVMMDYVAKTLLRVIRVPGITNLPDTVTTRSKNHLLFIVRPVALYPQQTSAIAGHMTKAITVLKIRGRLRVCFTCSPRICSV